MDETEVPVTPVPVETKQPEPGLTIPVPLIRWFCYIIFFAVLLLPFVIERELTVLQYGSAAMILGHFSGQLNKLFDK